MSGHGTVFSAALSGSRGCREEIRDRKECYDSHGKGINTEECYKEELNEKRCLAFHLCPLEAKRFYGSPGKGVEGKGECSLWAEYFAFRDSEDEWYTKFMMDNAIQSGKQIFSVKDDNMEIHQEQVDDVTHQQFYLQLW